MKAMVGQRSGGRRQFDDVLTSLHAMTYLGAHPGAPSRLTGVHIDFTTDGVDVRCGWSALGTLAWSSISQLTVGEWDAVESRITAPRVVLLGAWSLLVPKVTLVSYLIIRDGQGDWVFEVPDLSADELRRGLSRLQRYVPASADTEEAHQADDVARRLAHVDELKDQGTITDAERSDLRATILRML